MCQRLLEISRETDDQDKTSESKRTRGARDEQNFILAKAATEKENTYDMSSTVSMSDDEVCLGYGARVRAQSLPSSSPDSFIEQPNSDSDDSQASYKDDHASEKAEKVEADESSSELSDGSESTAEETEAGLSEIASSRLQSDDLNNEWLSASLDLLQSSATKRFLRNTTKPVVYVSTPRTSLQENEKHSDVIGQLTGVEDGTRLNDEPMFDEQAVTDMGSRRIPIADGVVQFESFRHCLDDGSHAILHDRQSHKETQNGSGNALNRAANAYVKRVRQAQAILRGQEGTNDAKNDDKDDTDEIWEGFDDLDLDDKDTLLSAEPTAMQARSDAARRETPPVTADNLPPQTPPSILRRPPTTPKSNDSHVLIAEFLNTHQDLPYCHTGKQSARHAFSLKDKAGQEKETNMFEKYVCQRVSYGESILKTKKSGNKRQRDDSEDRKVSQQRAVKRHSSIYSTKPACGTFLVDNMSLTSQGHIDTTTQYQDQSMSSQSRSLSRSARFRNPDLEQQAHRLNKRLPRIEVVRAASHIGTPSDSEQGHQIAPAAACQWRTRIHDKTRSSLENVYNARDPPPTIGTSHPTQSVDHGSDNATHPYAAAEQATTSNRVEGKEARQKNDIISYCEGSSVLRKINDSAKQPPLGATSTNSETAVDHKFGVNSCNKSALPNRLQTIRAEKPGWGDTEDKGIYVDTPPASRFKSMYNVDTVRIKEESDDTVVQEHAEIRIASRKAEERKKWMEAGASEAANVNFHRLDPIGRGHAMSLRLPAVLGTDNRARRKHKPKPVRNQTRTPYVQTLVGGHGLSKELVPKIKKRVHNIEDDLPSVSEIGDDSLLPNKSSQHAFSRGRKLLEHVMTAPEQDQD